ncbi:MAG: lysoplasmalogenase [Saprospiraceae bacterium]
MKQNSISKFSIIYLVICLANIIVLYQWSSYKMVVKPMIVLSLLGYYILKSQKQDVLMLLALVFALFGDIFLLFENDQFFIFGLGSFLIMQLLYTTLFIKDIKIHILSAFLSTIILGILVVSVFLYLYDGLGDLKIPVIVYMVAISAMVWTSLQREKSLNGHMYVLVGAMFFLASDALLAIAKFNGEWWGSNAMVMITYMAAQFAIVKGMIMKWNV